ncbi:MAG: hypothetical protein LBQ00_03285 [Syntrophobacterales bacterium]|jgi:hypothetical protein|nr:hypothetical protein [Syntrophobacterales bacterium]
MGEGMEGEGRDYTGNVLLSMIWAIMSMDMYSGIYASCVGPIGFGSIRYYCNGPWGMAVMETWFVFMTRILLDIADRDCGGKMAFALDRGYYVIGCITRAYRPNPRTEKKTPSEPA